MTQFWGSANGPVRRLLPHVRLLCGAFVIAACLVVPMHTTLLIGLAIAAVATWCLLCGLPARAWAACTVASLMLVLPILALTPWAGAGGTAPPLLRDRLLVTVAIGVRGSLCLFVSAATVASLRLSETHRAVTGLPLPRPLSVLLLQILNRAVFMSEQTGWVIRGLRLRSAGSRPGLRVTMAFPVVWMTRMLYEAERTAAAMVVRGYTTAAALSRQHERLAAADIAATAFAGALCVATVALRAWGPR